MNLKNFPYLTIFYFLAADLLLYVYIYFNDCFDEDHLIENLEVLLLSISCILCFVNRHRLVWFRYRLFSILAGFGCFFLIMEEISYGQRLLGFTPPDFFLQYNDSREINLHNINDGTLEEWMFEMLLYWAFISLLSNKFFIKRLMIRWIPVYNTEISILAILLYITIGQCYNFSDTRFPEACELLWYAFFLILFLSKPKKF